MKRLNKFSPVLALPDLTEHFMIFCNASKVELGCVLMRDRMEVLYQF